MTAALPAVGTRINHSGNLGTVKFVGSVLNTTGTWLGVEWDDPQRGKHSGVKDNHAYFSCSVPNAGSFIRPSPSIIYGVSFLHALLSKYIETPHGTEKAEIVLLGSSKGTIEVEAVGLDKIRGKLARLERLREVSLDMENVSSVDPSGQIKSKCPNIRGLDLSRNLIPSWDMVALIASELEFLERLSLNQNRPVPASDSTLMVSAFLNLKDVQLNGTLTTWQQLTRNLLPFMPKIETVEMGYNLLTRLCDVDYQPETSASSIQALNLDGNTLSDWQDISEALDPYPSLTRLILTSNQFTTVNPLPTTLDSKGLSRLKYLALSHNGISSWRSIDALATQCPDLESLNLTGNPLIEAKNHRPFVIARISSLTSLNGTSITSRERTDSELFYLSHIAQTSSAESDESRAQSHPRYRALCLKHGTPDTFQIVSDTLNNRLIRLTVHQIHTPLPANATLPTVEGNSYTLRVLPSMTLRTLRLKIRKTLKVPGRGAVHLYLGMTDDRVSTLEPEDDAHELDRWGLEHGSTLFAFIEDA